MADDDLYMSDPRHKSVEGMIAALQIMSKYMPNKEQQKFFFQAEHDEVFFNVDANDLPEDSADGRALIALGLHMTENDCWGWFT